MLRGQFITFRRHYLDQMLSHESFFGKVLDVGGKKEQKRGFFSPPLDNVDSWKYLNIDKATCPDFVGSAEDMNMIKNEAFDIIILTEVLEHIEHPERVLSECYRVLDPGGKLILTMPFLNGVHADPYDYQRWTSFKLKNSLKEVGFKSVIVKRMGGPLSVILDIIRVSLRPSSLSYKVYIRFVKVLFKFLLVLDKAFLSHGENRVTTGWYAVAEVRGE